MKIDEFENLIEGQREHPGLDFKASCIWDVKKLTKDILAMSNLPDGGYIIVGVEERENTFFKSGVEEHVRATFILDEMKDQVAKYADPMVDFEVHFPYDSDGLAYVVIKVFSFRETPTICKKDLDRELKASTIYYRNTNRRVESAAVSNVNDLRDIIELAAVRLMQRRRNFGFIIPNDNYKHYQSNIEAINKLAFVKEIKTKGYCEINVTPLSKNNLKSLSDCLNVVEKAQVRLDWDFPYIPRHPLQGSVDTFENGYQGISNLGSRKEVWRMHLSEHFYTLNSFVEDWMEGDDLRGAFAKDFPSGEYLFFYTTLLNYLTQLYVFLQRLSTQGLYKDGVKITINFSNIANRQLYLDSNNRIPLSRKRTTQANEILIEEEYSQNQLIEDNTQLSNEIILRISEFFQYTPPPDSILAEQNQFLNKR